MAYGHWPESYELRLKSGINLYLNAIITEDLTTNLYTSFVYLDNIWYVIDNSISALKIGNYTDLINYNNGYILSHSKLFFYKDNTKVNYNPDINNFTRSNENVIKDVDIPITNSRNSIPWGYRGY